MHFHKLGSSVRKKAIAKLSGHVIRTDYKLPWEADPLPKADAMLVMPATFNTINKWAQGIGDILVTSLLCEGIGRGSPPTVAVSCLKMDLVRHPAFLQECYHVCESSACISCTSQSATHDRS